MILRSIRVEGWRCFANPIELGPLDDRLNVIHGPNGIGKSTLLLALVRGLFDNHAVGGLAAESLRPWGRDLTPRVCVEFEHDGRRLRLSKQFLKSASSELSRLEDGQYVRLAEGEAADRKVRTMLSGDIPTRGVTDARHWGLAQVLWAPQDGLALPELSSGVAGAIRASLGAQVADASAGAVEQEVGQLYDAIYTRTGRLKGGKEAPRVVGLERDLDEARLRQCELQEKMAQFTTAGRRIEDLKSRHDQTARDQRQLEKQLDEARRKAQTYAELLANRDRQEATARAAEARYLALKQRIDNIAAAGKELAAAQAELDRLETDAPLQLEAVRHRREEAQQTETELAAVRTRRKDVDAANGKAKLAARFTENRQKLQALDEQIDSIDAARAELEELTQRRNALVAPDTARLKEIQDLLNRQEQTRVKLTAASITVSIVAERELELDIISGEQPGRQKIREGQPCGLRGSPEVAFRVPGVASFRATGPTGSVRQFREQLAQIKDRLDTLTEPFGTQEIDHLQRLHEQAAARDGEISNAKVRIDTLLSGRPPDEIRRQRAETAGTVEQILRKHADWADSPPEADTLAAEADRLGRTFVADVEQAEAEWKKAEKTFSLASQSQATQQAESAGAKRQIATIRQRLDTLTDDHQDDARRQAALQQLALEWDAAKGGVKQADEKLKQLADDPRQEVQVLKRQLDELRREASTAVQHLSKAEGQLEELAAQAPYSALSKVEETINRLEESIAGEQLRMDAVRLLYETIGRCKSETLETVLGPVERRATRLVERIAGARLGNIRFSESFLPEQVSPDEVEEPVPLDQISGGEKEQVYLAVRLALADVLFEDQRQLVVMDDVLTSTDTPRLARILTILEEAADRFQIVVLTCHPERYRGLSRAEFFDLEAILAAE